ncbi:MAG TPA: sigma-54-dependent Fis family transcriptional regulator [Polyangiaceae bacterium]|nr:sigma-54-dependent Fis family transcriptional regulator [Polyangiaceae bacterium]
MNDVVRERWSRVARLGLRREADAYPVATSDADLLERRERLAHAFRDELALLAPITGQLAHGPMVALVADREGVILSAHTDRRLVDPIARLRLVEGARWDEPTRGTNAVGTALVEGRAVAVVGEAHFEMRNRDIFCYATPVRDAYGDIVAVIDVSGPMANHDPSIGIAVQAAGLALERALRAIAYGDPRSGALAAIERLVHRASGPALLLESSGVVRIVNAAARSVLPIPVDQILTCERVFGAPFRDVFATATGRGGMRFETPAGAWRIEMDPIAGEGGRPLAMLAYFEADRPHVAPPAMSKAPSAFAMILGQDEALTAAKQTAARIAATALPVLLLAETGTGKELFARAIHAASDRKNGPFVAVNCGAFSPNLIASELFGYAPGAFTGASRHGSEGRINAATSGTLFLDEIAEMPDALQAALLRVLDDGIYQRIGDTRDRRADFRLVCATSRDLPARMAEGKFRNDLFYRIQGACITIPALRHRTDAVWLAEHLLQQELPPGGSRRFAADAKAWIAEHDWPGNVRELKSAIVHAGILAADELVITRAHFPPVLVGSARPQQGKATTRKEIFLEAIESTLEACDGNVSEAARRLGVGRGTIYRAIKDNKAE